MDFERIGDAKAEIHAAMAEIEVEMNSLTERLVALRSRHVQYLRAYEALGALDTAPQQVEGQTEAPLELGTSHELVLSDDAGTSDVVHVEVKGERAIGHIRPDFGAYFDPNKIDAGKVFRLQPDVFYTTTSRLFTGGLEQDPKPIKSTDQALVVLKERAEQDVTLAELRDVFKYHGWSAGSDNADAFVYAAVKRLAQQNPNVVRTGRRTFRWTADPQSVREWTGRKTNATAPTVTVTTSSMGATTVMGSPTRALSPAEAPGDAM